MANDYKFVPTSADDIVTSMVAAYEDMIGRSINPASPERLFIGWCADVIVQTRELINYAANQNIPSRAAGENLDALAEIFYARERPVATAATVTIQFTISAAQSSAVVIPAGTRVTDDNLTLMWETTEDAQINAGSLTVTVGAICQIVGEVGNGWTPGQLNQLVDIFPYYQSCVNTTESDGGSEEANDAEFYTALRESEDAYPSAGAVGAYIYWAKSVSTDIADVMAIRPVETMTKTLTVHDHLAFLGGSDLQENSLTVSYNGNTLGLDTDYSIDYTDGLLTIELLSSGSAYNAATLDVSVENILAGRVWIFGLMNDGSIPSAEMKASILAACSAESVRPLTDWVFVKDPVLVTYNISFTYYMSRESDLSASDIAAAVDAAVEEYKLWQAGKLGRDINPSKLLALLMATGVKRVDLVSPSFTVLADGTDNHAPELAHIGTVTIKNGGYENE